MVSLVALIVWRLHFSIVICGFLIFGTLDGIYLSSALTKVPNGAWFTLGLAAILSSVFVLWRFGKENQWHAEAEDRVPPSHLLSEPPSDTAEVNGGSLLRLAPAMGSAPITRLRGIGIFFDKTGSTNSTPAVLLHFLQKFQATSSVMVFFHIRPLSAPTVPPEERFSISRCFPLASPEMALRHVYRITVRHGYSDNVLTGNLGLLIYEHLRDFVIHDAAATDQSTSPHPTTSHDPTLSSSEASSSSSTPPEPTTSHQQTVRQDLDALQAAYEDQVVYVVGKEQMRIGGDVSKPGGWARRIALAAFLWLRSNTGSRVANMDLEVEKLVEVGFVKLI